MFAQTHRHEADAEGDDHVLDVVGEERPNEHRHRQHQDADQELLRSRPAPTPAHPQIESRISRSQDES